MGDERQEIAKDIMEYIKRRLLLHLHYLNRAIYALTSREHAQLPGLEQTDNFYIMIHRISFILFDMRETV